MLEATGDFWTYPANWRCVPTNGVVASGRLVMGAGLAKEANQLYDTLALRWGEWVAMAGNVPKADFYTQLISFPTKHDFRSKSCTMLISKSAYILKGIADEMPIAGIVLPRVGCGCGGLLWKNVRPILAKHLDDRFTVVSKG